MARKASPPKGPTPVESTAHGDKRTNIPTADALVFVDPEVEEVRQVRYARDESLDPQPVWRGKYDDSARVVEVPSAGRVAEPALGAATSRVDNLVADAPPIYFQEKIDPRALVENLRRTVPPRGLVI